MISHVTYISYIALLSTYATLQLGQPQSPYSRAEEIFHFRLILFGYTLRDKNMPHVKLHIKLH